MANVVKLYTSSYTDDEQWELIPNKFLVIDDIGSYLATKTSVTINDFQYVKNELEIGINVDLSQAYSQPATITSIKYVSISNTGERIHYYFVKKTTWRSKSAVRLELVLDVLNTFHEGTDYNFKSNTKINREHKNRFLLQAYELYMQIEDLYDDVGTLAEGDTIYLKYESEGDTYNICRGTILSISYTAFKIKLIAPYDASQVIATIEAHTGNLILYKDSSNYYSFGGYVLEFDANVYRNIDKTPENIMPILVCDNLAAEKVEHQVKALQCDWYLLYRNQNNPSESLVNPVECYLIPSEEIKTAYGYIANGRLIPSFIEEGKYYWFGLPSGTTATLSNGITISGLAYCLVTKANNKLNVSSIINVTTSGYDIDGNFNNIDYITFSPVPVAYAKTNDFKSSSTGDLYYLSLDQSFNNSGTENKLDAIDYLDRTDAKNIKLIKLPYCPYNFTVYSNIIQVSADWDYVSLTQSGGGIINCLKLVSLNTKLEETLDDEDYNPFRYLYFSKLSSIDTSLTHLREQANYESKLYHSEFFTPTFYYDSFAFKFELEKVDKFYLFSAYTKTSAKNEIKFNVTSTINSKFMFTFNNYEVFDNEQNYAKYLPIARNNEEVLYNVPYINYIRSGYQYDVKNKNISNISNALGVGLSAASIGASLLFPSAALKVAGVVASIVSMATSVKNAIITSVNNENSLKQKISQYQNQASSVAGSDDVDLMSIYAENRLKYLEYEPRQEMEKLIFDLFFYAGYKSDRMGIPTHHNRVNFDYLECDASLENIASIPNDCLEELINCFKNGVTYLHKTNRAVDKWDFTQKYENWEMDFYG